MKQILIVALVLLLAGCYPAPSPSLEQPAALQIGTFIGKVGHDSAWIFTTPNGTRCVSLSRGLSCDFPKVK